MQRAFREGQRAPLHFFMMAACRRSRSSAGELVDFVLAVDGDGLARGVQDDLAVVALANVGLHFGEKLGFHLAVEVVGKLLEEIGAGHGIGPPSFCRK